MPPAPNTPGIQGRAAGHDPGLGRGHAPTQSRSWIITAFNRLVLGRRYESVSVGEVSRRAGVGRSTFYEHFDGKDDLLRQAVQPILTPLADAAVGRSTAGRVQFVLDHVAEHRTRTLAMLGGPTRSQIEQSLAELVRERLALGSPEPDDAAHTLEAARLAGAHIALLTAWLKDGFPSCPSSRVAAMFLEGSPRDRQGV